MRKSEEGITLISLTITIIILIILASVLISATDGLGGIKEAINTAENVYIENKAEVDNEVQSIENKWGNVINKNTIDNAINVGNITN